MREFLLRNPKIDPLNVKEQLEMDARRQLGKDVVFHHAVMLKNEVHGKLDESVEEATTLKEFCIKKAGWGAPDFNQEQIEARVALWKSQAEVVEIAVGKEYHPFPYLDDHRNFYLYTHGVDDGFHGAPNKDDKYNKKP